MSTTDIVIFILIISNMSIIFYRWLRGKEITLFDCILGWLFAMYYLLISAGIF